jgi:hypothetical protein
MALITINVFGPGYSGGDFSDLTSAEASISNANKDLIGTGNSYKFLCKGNISSAHYLTFKGPTPGGYWKTDATHNITIQADPNVGAYMVGDGFYCLVLDNVPYTKIIGMHFQGTCASALFKTGEVCTGSACIDCTFNASAAQWGITHDGTQTNYLINCTITNALKWGLRVTGASVVYVYNCTILNSVEHGINITQYGTVIGHNNYVGNSGLSDLFNTLGAGNGTFTLTKTWTSDSSGTAQHTVASCNFTNITPGSENLLPRAGSSLFLQADDLSSDANYPFNIDISGSIRPTGKWDIGAYQVSVAAPTGLTYSTQSATYTQNSAITSNNPSVTGVVLSYSVSPALPAGLSLDTTTGIIAGNPTTPQIATSYTITATNNSGSTTDSISITINAASSPLWVGAFKSVWDNIWQ